MAHDEKSGAAVPPPSPTVRRTYSPPRLERFGTIRELTLGAGQQNNFDGGHPPGHNRSRL